MVEKKNKQKGVNMIAVGGIIALIAAVAAIVGIILCKPVCPSDAMKCGYCEAFVLIVSVPIFILGLAISLVSYIVRLVTRLNMRRKGNAQGEIAGTNKGGFWPSARVAFAIIFGLVGGFSLITAISSPPPNSHVYLGSFILLALSALLFAIGHNKRQ